MKICVLLVMLENQYIASAIAAAVFYVAVSLMKRMKGETTNVNETIKQSAIVAALVLCVLNIRSGESSRVLKEPFISSFEP